MLSHNQLAFTLMTTHTLYINNQQHAIDAAAVFIDLDGTLVNTLGDFEAALRATLAELQLPTISRQFIENTVGKGTEYLLQQVLKQVGASADVFETALACYQQHYTHINGQFSQAYAGVPEGLKRLYATKLPLACITNKPTEHARALLQHLGLADYFVCIHGGDAFARKKPDPMPLLETAKLLNVAPEQALMIGDSANDAQAARTAHCPIVLLTYGYNHGQPIHTVAADGYIDSLMDIHTS